MRNLKGIVWLLAIVSCSVGIGEARAQNRLLEWENTRELLAPPLTKERILMGEAQRNVLFISVRSNPANNTNKVNLAVTYERLGQSVQALELYRVLIQDDEFYEVAISGFIKNLYLSENLPGTLRFISLAESKHSLGWEALLVKSEILTINRRFSRALVVLERAWESYREGSEKRDPIIAQIEKKHMLNNLGFLYQQMGDQRGLSEVRRQLADVAE